MDNNKAESSFVTFCSFFLKKQYIMYNVTYFQYYIKLLLEFIVLPIENTVFVSMRCLYSTKERAVRMNELQKHEFKKKAESRDKIRI